PCPTLSLIRSITPPPPQATLFPYTTLFRSGSLHLREVWRIIRKRRWLILCIALIVTTLATIDAYRTKSTYRASAFIEIGKDSPRDRKSTRLNSSHEWISYAVFCLKKKHINH